MCGILGYIALKNQQTDEKKFKKALDLQKHRGPDSFGIYKDNNFIFGHRRLSIIDLSDNAKQPMTAKNGEYILTFNGEIYNYIELKEELIKLGHKFYTNSDSEVLLKSYKEWGKSCVNKFIGMFAFAIYDKKQKSFFIVRDRLGIKPLYYYFNNSKFIFASEIKSILYLIESKKEYKKWTKLTRIGKISWFVNMIHCEIYKQIQQLPKEMVYVFKLVDADQNYEFYKKMASFFGLKPLMSEKDFLSLKKLAAKSSENRVKKWTEKEEEEFLKMTKKLREIY
jgi:asparagine synthase (glutamine-hydrolysing)